jgi:hypothetical protein
MLAASLLLLALTAAIVPAASADVYTPRRMKVGGAMWLIPTAKAHVYRGYFVDAWEWFDVLDSKSFGEARAFRGSCRVKTAKRYTEIACTGAPGDSVSSRPVDSDFQVDPLLQSATLRIRHGSRTEVVEWTGKQPAAFCGYAYSSDGPDEGDDFSGQGQCFSTTARATGHLFGHHVATSGRLDQGWFGYGLDTPGLPELSTRGNRVELHLRVPRR